MFLKTISATYMLGIATGAVAVFYIINKQNKKFGSNAANIIDVIREDNERYMNQSLELFKESLLAEIRIAQQQIDNQIHNDMLDEPEDDSGPNTMH